MIVCEAGGWTDRLLSAIPATATPLAVPGEFSRREGPREIVLAYREWRVDGLGELRATDIVSAKLQIHATMLFPNDPEVQPVFAAELVVMGPAVRAAVADLQPLTREAARRAELREALAAVAPLTSPWRTPDPPEWCAEHFTDSALLALRHTREELPQLEAVYDGIVHAFAKMALESPPRAHEALARYKRHHFIHTPGRRYMSQAFGAEWTERFLAEGMYRE